MFNTLLIHVLNVADKLARPLLHGVPWLAASAFVIASAHAEPVVVPPVFASKCASCHGTPPGTGSYNMPTLGDNTRLGSSTSFINFLNTFSPAPGHPLAGSTPMAGLVSDPGEANELRTYLLTVRDAMVKLNGAGITTTATSNYIFSTKVEEGSSSTATALIHIANPRSTPIASVALSGSLQHFSIASNTCTTSPAISAAAPGGTDAAGCDIGIKFSPTTGTTNDQLIAPVVQLNLTFAAGQAPGSAQYQIRLTGTSAGPPFVAMPGFSSAGFDALTSFSAILTGSKTLCPTIQNSGTGTLTLSFSTAQAPGSSADFSNYFELGDNADCPSVSRACNTSMSPGSAISGSTNLVVPTDSACTLALKFNPGKFGEAGTTGARSAMLRITHNAPTAGTVKEYLMTGEATLVPRPKIGVSTNPGVVGGRVSPPAFRTQVVNTASAEWNEFLVFNIGTADGLDITGVTQTNAQEFLLTENCSDALPLARVSGSNPHCNVNLRFTPNAIGERCTTVTVRTAVGGNGVLDICGTGVAAPRPDLTLSLNSIDFGRRFINAAYPPQSLVISNGAGATDSVRINLVTIVGSGFALVPATTAPASCDGINLAPGTSCTVRVQFTPDPARPETRYSASLQIDTNDALAPRRTVALAAVAGTVATPPVLQLSNTPAQIEFADFVVAGQQSQQPLRVTVRNAGPGNATIDGVRMVGADASSFSASGCSDVLAESDTCVISVNFAPGSGGQKRAQLEVLASLSIPPPLVTVTGRGVGGTSAILTASATSLSMGSVRVGAQSAPVELRLSGAGDGVVQVTSLQASGPFTVQSKTCPSVPFTLPRGGDCTVTVIFTPTNAGAASASLRISSDSDTKPMEVALTGTGEEKANLSSGGCTIASGDTPFDPTLWALVLLAIGAIVYRRRVRAAGRKP